MASASLTALFDPRYQLNQHELYKLDRTISANFAIERERAYNTLEREHVRGRYAAEREHFKADRDDSRQERAISAQYDLEARRAETALSVEQARGQNHIAAINADHANQIARMEEDLKGRIMQSGIQLGADVIKSMVDYNQTKGTHIRDWSAVRANLRAQVTEKLAGALIGELSAQREHARKIELMREQGQIEHDTREHEFRLRLEAYLKGLCEAGMQAKARDEISRMVQSWG